MTLARRLRAAMDRPAPASHIAGDDWDWAGDAVPLQAAVLIVVIDRKEPTVILTLRPETMARHAGQIAFPGGRIESGDEDAIAAALREAQEEIGLESHIVEIVGTAEPYRTVTGFEVVPVVGVIPDGTAIRPCPREVSAVIEVPLAYLTNSSHHLVKQMDYRGCERSFFEIDWHGHRIWGATAAMIVNLSKRLEAKP